MIMMRMHAAAVVGALGIASAHVAVQEPAAPEPPTSETTQLLPAPSKNAYRHLFAMPPAPQNLQGLTARVRSVDAQPRVVCGMTLVPAKPDLDPKMVHQRPPEPNVDYKIRALTPRICRE
jgi:hypothetical protein